MMQRNWKPVIGSLLKVLQDHRFVLDSVDDDGKDHTLQGTPRQRRQRAKEIIDSVVVSSLYVRHPDHNKLLMLYIVLGNEPENIVADKSDVDILNIALEQFSKKWENKTCPTK